MVDGWWGQWGLVLQALQQKLHLVRKELHDIIAQSRRNDWPAAPVVRSTEPEKHIKVRAQFKQHTLE